MHEFDVTTIEQVIVLGRGVELNSDPLPGNVVQGSERSGDSFDRAVTGALYSQVHPEVERVVFSGGTSFMVPDHEVPEDSSEGLGMWSVALGTYRATPGRVDPKSRTTVGNFVESVRAGLLDPSKTIGIVVDERQRKNAVRAARLVMPHTNIRIISPYNNPNLVATMPDVQLSTDPSMQPYRRDRISGAIYRVAMIGVTPGDLEKIDARDQFVQRNILRGVRGARAIRGALHNLVNRDSYQTAA